MKSVKINVDLYPLPSRSIAPPPKAPQRRGAFIWLEQNVAISIGQVVCIVIGHVALGFIIGIALGR